VSYGVLCYDEVCCVGMCCCLVCGIMLCGVVVCYNGLRVVSESYYICICGVVVNIIVFGYVGLGCV